MIRFDPVWAQGNIKIVTKEGRLAPLRYNTVQMALNRRLRRSLSAGKPVRWIILKARQEGVSTWTQTVFYTATNHTPGARAIILSHDPEGTANLYGMYDTFYENHEARLPTVSQTLKGLRFAPPHGGRIVVQTAAKRNAGSGQTYQFCHISELSKWQWPDETMLSLMQAIPQTANSMAVIESTAYGAGGYFHEAWEDAVTGESDWEPIFLPWFAMREYAVDPDEIDMGELGKDDRFNFYEGEEDDLRKEFDLSDRQLAWRRWSIRNNCKGSVLRFHQEYPARAEEAFIMPGTPRFDTRTLMNWLQEATDPEFVGRTPLDLESKIAQAEMVPDGEGWLRLWERPQAGHRYVIFADCAGADWSGDHNNATIFDRNTRAMVGSIHGIRGADLYARALANVGVYFNEATIGVEVNGIGEACQSHLRHWYPERALYHRLPIDQHKRRPGKRIGWYTGHIQRQNLIEDLDAAIRDDSIHVPCADTIRELMAFQYVAGPRNGDHAPGMHDDRVFGIGGCLQIADYSVAGEYDSYDPGIHSASSAPVATEI